MTSSHDILARVLFRMSLQTQTPSLALNQNKAAFVWC